MTDPTTPPDFRTLAMQLSGLTAAEIMPSLKLMYELGQQQALTAPTGWRPIETAPKNGKTPILVPMPDNRVCLAVYRNGRWWAGANMYFHPDWWMPLPAAPSPTTGPEEKDNDR